MWRTSPASANPADWLLRRTDITLDSAGSFTFGCLAGYVYSFTTTTNGQGIIKPSIPASQPFQLPYSDGWTRDASATGTMPPYLAPQDGSFEFARAADGSGSHVGGPDNPDAAHLLASEELTRHTFPVRGHRQQRDGQQLQGQREPLLHRKRPIRRRHGAVQPPGP